MRNSIPPKRGCLNHQNGFLVGRRYLDLYIDPTVTTPTYSLFWRDEETPVQHKMGAREVFNVLSQELERAGAKNKPEEYRQEITVQPKGIKKK